MDDERRQGWVETPGRRIPSRGALLAAVAVVAVAGWLAFTARQYTSTAQAPSPPPVPGAPTVLFTVPRAGAREQPDRILPAVVPATAGPWRASKVQPLDDSMPVRWDPCREIRYVVDGGPRPEGADALLAEAFARVGRVSGLRFVREGTTDEKLADGHEPFQPQRYGDRWAPVLVSWQRAADWTSRGGCPTWIEGPPRPTVYVSGVVVLDASRTQQLLVSPGERAAAKAEMVAAVAGLVGLDVDRDPGRLFSAGRPQDVTDLGPGDLAGLAELGRGPCAPWL